MHPVLNVRPVSSQATPDDAFQETVQVGIVEHFPRDLPHLSVRMNEDLSTPSLASRIHKTQVARSP